MQRAETEHIVAENEVPRLLLDAQETARALSISERTLWGLTDKGEVPCVRIGRRVLYSQQALREWIGGQAGILESMQAGDGESVAPDASDAGIHVEGNVGAIILQNLQNPGKGDNIVHLKKNTGNDPPRRSAWGMKLVKIVLKIVLDQLPVIGRLARLFGRKDKP